jgi:hypothetical protein
MRGLLLLAAALVAAPSPGRAGQAGPPEVRAVRAAGPIVVDGSVDSAEWNGAPVLSAFTQFQPLRGEPSAHRTEALVLYSATHLYFAMRAWDDEPVVAQITQRDGEVWNEDSFQVYLDSFGDGRSGYYFMVSAIGTQTDGRLAEDGRSTDGAWDAPWQAATRRTDYGWSVEVALPLASLKYVAGADVTWGLNVARTRRRTLERSYWSGPMDYWGRISQAGRLTGLSVEPASDRHQVVPFVLSQTQEARAPVWQGGVDLRYGFTPQFSGYATFNPDFATIEADQEEVNLTRFELSLPEKRQFFLEGGELFNQRIRTFYSRRVADISWGGKVLGKQGGWTVAALQAHGKAGGGLGAPDFTVLRLQRDVGRRSNVSVMGASRRIDGRHEGSVEVDANLVFTDRFSFTGQLVESYGRHGRGTMGFFVRPSYDSATGHFHVRYTHLGDRLADNINRVGFVIDDDRRELDSAAEKTWWPASGPLERVQYRSNYNGYWSQTGRLRRWRVDESVDVELRSRWSGGVSLVEEFIRFEKGFGNRQVRLETGFNTRQYESVRGGFTFGRNFDADFQLWSASARRKLNERLSAEYELQRLRLDPDPRDESTWIHVARVSQFFTRDLFLRVFLQTNSAIDRRNVQAVFVYRYLPPFGTLQVAYQRGTAAFGERSRQGHTLFLKATTVF